jgi:hypothetical protein
LLKNIRFVDPARSSFARAARVNIPFSFTGAQRQMDDL